MLWKSIFAASLVAVALLGVALYQLAGPDDVSSEDELVVYSAAGMRRPVAELTEYYERLFGTNIRIDYGSSGELEAKLKLDAQTGNHRADVYIPADSTFSQRTQAAGLTAEAVPLASFHLVLAYSGDTAPEFASLQQLAEEKHGYVLCHALAGAGEMTERVLKDDGFYDQLKAGAKTVMPTVTEAAQAIKNSGEVDYGIIWSSTAEQFGLNYIEHPELSGSTADITATVVASTDKPTEALRFIRFMSSPEKGNPAFARHKFSPVKGDSWAAVPEILFYSGSVNRGAILDTVREFEEREGVVINTQYAGCGQLVASIKTGTAGVPDVFLTCDASYMEKVGELFGNVQDISQTDIVMVVRAGNPKNIRTLDDLTRPGLAVGTSDKTLSALGSLTWQLFEHAGIRDALERDDAITVTTPTAHELIVQLQGNSRLDVALVYRANCVNLPSSLEIIPIPMDAALAVQNVGIARNSRYPFLTERLIEALSSVQSRERFESNHFAWKADS